MDESGVIDVVNAQRTDTLTQKVWLRAVRGGRMTVTGARDDYLADMAIRGLAPVTISDVNLLLDAWIRCGRIGTSPIASIGARHVSDYVNNPVDPVRYSTRCRRLVVLRAFFDFCTRSECMPVNPCLSLTVRTAGLTHDQLVPRKKIPLTNEEIERLLDTTTTRTFWYGAILLGKYFGFRLSTAACLEWASLGDLTRIKVFTQKGHIIVDEPLPPDLQQWFSTWDRVGELGYCFPAQASMILCGKGGGLSVQFQRLCAKAGVVGKSFHCLRAAAVTRELDRQLSALGGPERALISSLVAQKGMRAVQRLIGHAEGSTVTAARYFSPQPPQPEPAQRAG